MRRKTMKNKEAESVFDKEQKRLAAGRTFVRARVAVELTDVALLSIHFGMPESAFMIQMKLSYATAKSLLTTDASEPDLTSSFKLAK